MNLVFKTNGFDEDYMLTQRVLGQGIHGKVYECQRRSDGARFALKLLEKDKERRSRREIELHHRCSMHPNIASIVDVYDNVRFGKQKYLLVMELLNGGELFHRIQQKSVFTEVEAQSIMRKIANAVHHLHTHKVAHRDLKPENLLYANEGDEAELKLIDFGFAKECVHGSQLTTPCYTPFYAAPEVLKTEMISGKKTNSGEMSYDQSCDMWSLGVIMYILLAGYPPFYSYNNNAISPGMKARIKRGEYDFPDDEWASISDSAKDLIRRLLETDPSKRATIHECLAHPWLTTIANSAPATPLLTPQVLQRENAAWKSTQEDLSTALAKMRVDNVLTVRPLEPATNKLLQRRTLSLAPLSLADPSSTATASLLPKKQSSSDPPESSTKLQ